MNAENQNLLISVDTFGVSIAKNMQFITITQSTNAENLRKKVTWKYECSNQRVKSEEKVATFKVWTHAYSKAKPPKWVILWEYK